MSGSELWNNNRTEHWVSAAWAEGACKALAVQNPEAPALSLEACVPQEGTLLDWVDPVWVVFPCDVAAASVAVGCPGEVLKRLGALAIGGSENDDRLAAEPYRELISQATAAIGATLRSRTGGGLHFEGGVDVDEAPDVSLAVEFRFEIDGENCSIVLAPNQAFVEAVGDAAEGDESRDEAESLPAAENAHRNLEMLLDLEMEVAVSFGQTEMRLKDVLKLSVGSIVELRRQASDPVEVLVNDTVIARGEVVVVDSNYGVRITDVSSRRERIQCIF